MADPQNDRSQRRLKLTGGERSGSGDAAFGSWGEAMELVIQQTLVLLADVDDPSSKELESALFAKSLFWATSQWRENHGRLPLELEAFNQPVGMYVFCLKDRRYTCLEQVPPEGLDTGEEQIGIRLRKIMVGLAKQVSSFNVDLEDRPTTRELESQLFDHVLEAHKPDVRLDDAKRNIALDWTETDISLPHEARVAAIRNWQSRLHKYYMEKHSHRNEETSWYAYPYVDVAVLDGEHLVLLLASPLDPQFIDEKVEERWRAPELTLAVFKQQGSLSIAALKSAQPLLKQAFARTLFSNMLNQNNQTLAESSEERAAILRHWVTIASGGLPGLIGREQAKAPFDGFTFCEAVVREVLCARVPGVNQAEVFPFNRAFIFRETGVESDLSTKPMAVRVLESSVLSNAPADRGRFLTSRELRIRGTEDFECDLSQKRVEEEDCFDFFIHPGNDNTLILSRQPKLENKRRDAALQRRRRSRNPDQADQLGYRIPIPELDDVELLELDPTVYNLLGRLNKANSLERGVRHPKDRRGGHAGWRVTTYKEDFERLRLSVTEKADSKGLTFISDHGLFLETDAPTLDRVQRAYFAYLDDRFREQDERFLRDRGSQDNMKDEQINELLDRDREIRLQQEQRIEESSKKETDRSHLSKVVCVSFSWALHDKNTQLWLDRSRAARRSGNSIGDETKALLGEEYSYTLVLVADSDPEKSQARLQSEREDLKLFFQLLMGSIWSDRFSEYVYLDKRSRSIGASLQQFLHQVKGKLPSQADKQEIDQLLENLNKLISSERPPVEWRAIDNSASLIDSLLETADESTGNEARMQRLLTRLVQISESTWEPEFRMLESRLPALESLWSGAVVSDAFHVAFKNAVEAAIGGPREGAFVSLQLQASPRNDSGDSEDWFLDVVIENTGGPISPSRLKALNSPDPIAVDRGTKPGSTGVGIFLARFQLGEVIGQGADLLLANVGEDVVQCRLRLPAKRLQSQTGKTSADQVTAPEREYMLYVEDAPEVFTSAYPFLSRIANKLDRDVEHCRGAARGVELVELKIPTVLLSDLHIQNSEDPEEQARAKYGHGFLMAFMSSCAERGQHPPIWLFTGEDPRSVHRQLVPKLVNSGWRWVEAEGASVAELAASGIITVMPNKRPHELDLAWLEKLFRAARAQPSKEELDRDGAGTTLSDAPAATFLEVELDNLVQLANKGGIGPDSVVIIPAKATTRVQLVELLVRWFGLPPLPDLDPGLSAQPTRDPVFDSVIHTRLVFVITVAAKVWTSLPPRLIYWALCRNILVTRKPPPREDLAASWTVFHREEKGPLSRLRHDLKTSWAHADLHPLLNHAIPLLNSAESKLLLSRDEVEIFESALRHGGPEALDRVQSVFMRPADTKRLRVEVCGILQDFSTLFDVARGKPSFQTEVHARQGKLATLVARFIGGE